MPKKKEAKIIAKKSDAEEARETYLHNRNNMLEDFEACLEEIKLDEPSVGGVIAGMNFQQFSAGQVFFFIKEQETYIKYAEEYSPAYVIISEEKVILKDMIKKAKKAFGKNYKAWYVREL